MFGDFIEKTSCSTMVSYHKTIRNDCQSSDLLSSSFLTGVALPSVWFCSRPLANGGNAGLRLGAVPPPEADSHAIIPLMTNTEFGALLAQRGLRWLPDCPLS
nr:hypothetical protein [Marinicella sp. W31]MDC2879922.1 hypothetical protein [Marinicella sp. W31]